MNAAPGPLPAGRNVAQPSAQHALRGRRLKLAEALLAGEGVPAAAAFAGYSRSHAWRVAQEPDVAGCIRRERDARLRRLADRLASAAERAIAVLAGLADSDSTDPGIRVRAAAVLVEKLLPLVEIADVVERLGVVERRLAEGGAAGSNGHPIGRAHVLAR